MSLSCRRQQGKGWLDGLCLGTHETVQEKGPYPSNLPTLSLTNSVSAFVHAKDQEQKRQQWNIPE